MHDQKRKAAGYSGMAEEFEIMDFGPLTIVIRILGFFGYEVESEAEALAFMFLIVCSIGLIYFHHFHKKERAERKELRGMVLDIIQSFNEREERFNDRMDRKLQDLRSEYQEKDRQIFASMAKLKAAMAKFDRARVYILRTLRIHGDHFDVNDKNIDRANDKASEALTMAAKAIRRD